MKRALFVAVGTIAGLTATLRYTPENPLLTAGTDLALGGTQTLGGTQSVAPVTQSSPTVPAVAASKSAVGTPTKTKSSPNVVGSNKKKPKPVTTKSATPKATPKKTVKPTPGPTKTVKPTPTPSNTVKPTPTVTATPTPQVLTATGAGALAGGYGTVQVRIQVTNGRMTSITPLSWPTGGTSSAISSYSIPLLIDAALKSQSSRVATISGASYTSAAFRSTLASAMAQAGL